MSKTKLFLLIAMVWLGACSPEKSPEGLQQSMLQLKKVPVFQNAPNKGLLEVDLLFSDTMPLPVLKKAEIIFDHNTRVQWLDSVEAVCYALEGDIISAQWRLGSTKSIGSKLSIQGEISMQSGLNRLSFDFFSKPRPLGDERFYIKEVRLHFEGGEKLVLMPEEKFAFREAIVLREAGQDSCHTYRIPGLVTTSKGTLIAVYDNRYLHSKDLQGHIDIGMSRSTDAGSTWEAMKVIMDMGEWGGNPQELNGIGDPCVLYDPATGTIWVAALWMTGSSTDQMLWWASKPGMSPYETGQFMLVRSTDDGLTWSEPINITGQIKQPQWQLLLAGPGRGLGLKDGTLVFPAQFKEDIGTKAIDGGQYTCYSTIICSKDGGETWHIGSGAKPNTTEAQVVQLSDGSLMLNMRDDLNRLEKGENNGRAVAISHDLGETWIPHPSSNSLLPESNCMASLISFTTFVEGEERNILLFSNPNHKHQRTHMTIKASMDEGKSWPEKYQLLLNESHGFGYSCLTIIDQHTLGILYEGPHNLFFQKIPLKDVMGKE